MLERNPHLAGVLDAGYRFEPKRTLQRFKEQFQFARTVRRKRFDLAIDLTTSDRSAILTRLTGARKRLGYRSVKGFLGRQRCYTETVQAQKHEHIVLKHLRILQPLGIREARDSLIFVVTEADRARVGSLVPSGREIFQVHPVSRIAKKNWPAKYMAETVNWISARGWLPIITGSSEPEEKRWIAELCRHLSGDYLDLSGQLTLHQLGAVSERVRCFIGVDTAPMHIAAAAGAPVIGVFGPTSERMWGPWCAKKLILSREDLDCRLPCKDKHHCPHIACLREMGPETVIPKLERFLAQL
jgi:heptosyltransferase-3